MSHTEKLARDIRAMLITIAILGTIWWVFDFGKDDTDPPGARSGFSLLTDAGTGCQYLAHSGLTPRLDANGKQMGCRQ
ncbi:DUF6440 family protein [Mesorhizobium sp. Root172]|uniref:DUF6440 family protein n=1 Tax=Mesorhizobium sp. Root172 TaxID=1736481 RepID=UPI0006FBA87C|nr:DUF6440 family protein [Mesorhizobium sp. Root172]KRB22717.1 hypothetical protein ASE05_16175 [Mesorhizobium sp. Root172]